MSFLTIKQGLKIEYQEHGKFEIILENNIIVVTLEGELNEVAAKHYYAEMKVAAQNIYHKPFCVLTIATKFIGATPKAYIMANNCNKWLVSQKNFLRRAIIVKNKIYVDIAKNQMDVYEKNTSQFNDFTEELDARRWLTEVL